MKSLLLTTLCSALLLAGDLTAQSSNPRRPLWGDLAPGPYAVGFKVTYRLDRSRTWDPTPDSIAEGESARPIRVSVWYPARPARAARPMPYRGYLMLTAPNRNFGRLNAMIERADVTPMRDVIFLGSDSLFQKLLASPTAAFANAPAAAGRFPVIGYSAGYNNRSHDNSVLAEYLASYGFIVVTVPQLGTAATRLTLRINPVDLETQTRDLELAIGEVLAGPNAEPRKLGIMGYSMGGVVALLLAARNPNVDAIVGLDPSIRAPRFVELVTRAPQFEPRNIRAPLLSLQSGNASEASAQDTTVVHELRFADRYVALVGNAAHGDFSDFAAYADLFGLTCRAAPPPRHGRRTPPSVEQRWRSFRRRCAAIPRPSPRPCAHRPCCACSSGRASTRRPSATLRTWSSAMATSARARNSRCRRPAIRGST